MSAEADARKQRYLKMRLQLAPRQAPSAKRVTGFESMSPVLAFRSSSVIRRHAPIVSQRDQSHPPSAALLLEDDVLGVRAAGFS